MPKQYYSAQDGLGYLGEDLLIQGTVHTEKKIVVSCTLEGSILGDQEIIVSETGNVNGKIEGNVVIVAGKINGDMLVHERLEVNATANLHGEVHVPSGQLLIQEGAYMEGQCITSKDKHNKKQLVP